MKDLSPELKKLLLACEGDIKKLLKEYPDVQYLYALSDLRENLLEWYDFDPNASLLQIGSDYGALTGLYSRKTARVTVLEESPGKMEVSRLRYPNSDNVRYVKGNLDTFDEAGFDYAVMIGSLTDPCKAHIEKAKSLLNPRGRLILALCNPLGLKYQAGALPDETCLTKARLLELLCGEDGKDGGARFYYPLPDYRLAFSLYSDSCLPGKGDLTHAFLAYDYPPYVRFDIGKMYDRVCEGKTFEILANSYLTIWSRHEED